MSRHVRCFAFICPPLLAAAAGVARAEPPAVDDPTADADEVYEAVAEVSAPPRQATQRELDARELTTVPGTSGDPLKAIEVLPGVARSTQGDPILRGAAQQAHRRSRGEHAEQRPAALRQ